MPAATGGLDLAMPGPNPLWGPALADAVRSGAVPAEVLADKVVRLLRTARQAGALAGAPAAAPDGARQVLVGSSLLRRVVAASFVLLHNDGSLLPLDHRAIRSVAVIGPNAADPVIQGGGSARVIPAALPSLTGSLAAALGDGVTITTAGGCRTWTTVPDPPPGTVTDPETGEPGVRLEFETAAAANPPSEHRSVTALAWWDGLPPGVGWGDDGIIRMRTVFRALRAGPYLLGASGVGRLTVTVAGTVVADGHTPVPADPVETMTRPGEIRAEVRLTAGERVPVTVEFRPAGGCQGPVALRLGIVRLVDDAALLAEAAAAAAAADVAVVVVGSSQTTESEGYDRGTLALPVRQDELVERVAAANQRTVVVVNAGTPVLMPWARRAAALL